MSIKIYDGMKSYTKDVFKLSSDIRDVLEPIFLNKFFKIYSDYLELFSESKTSIPLNIIPEYFWESTEKVSKSRLDFDLYNYIKNLHEKAAFSFSSADIFYDVVLIQNGIEDEAPLVLMFGESSREYEDELKKKGILKDYGYWDNSDPDENVSDEEWDKRRLEWSNLFYAAPSEIGLTINCPGRMQTSIFVSKKSRKS